MKNTNGELQKGRYCTVGTWWGSLQPGAVVSDDVLVVELGVELHLPHHLLLGGLGAGQRDPLHRVVNVVDLVLRLEDDAESATTKALPTQTE